jgi:hypothetical protein
MNKTTSFHDFYNNIYNGNEYGGKPYHGMGENPTMLVYNNAARKPF